MPYEDKVLPAELSFAILIPLSLLPLTWAWRDHREEVQSSYHPGSFWALPNCLTASRLEVYNSLSHNSSSSAILLLKLDLTSDRRHKGDLDTMYCISGDTSYSQTPSTMALLEPDVEQIGAPAVLQSQNQWAHALLATGAWAPVFSGVHLSSLFSFSNSALGQDHLNQLNSCNVERSHIYYSSGTSLCFYVNVWVRYMNGWKGYI